MEKFTQFWYFLLLKSKTLAQVTSMKIQVQLQLDCYTSFCRRTAGPSSPQRCRRPRTSWNQWNEPSATTLNVSDRRFATSTLKDFEPLKEDESRFVFSTIGSKTMASHIFCNSLESVLDHSPTLHPVDQEKANLKLRSKAKKSQMPKQPEAAMSLPSPMHFFAAPERRVPLGDGN